MTVHVKKAHPEPFQAVRDGRKTFEWRREDDGKFEVGDLLILLEWSPGGELIEQCARYDRFGHYAGMDEERTLPGYTGEVERVRVTYVLRDKFDVPEGFAVLGIERVDGRTAPAFEPQGLAREMEKERRIK